jgi:hypothetical protein
MGRRGYARQQDHEAGFVYYLVVFDGDGREHPASVTLTQNNKEMPMLPAQ